MREEKQIVRERLAALRNKMAEKGWDACLFVCSDFHGSEYIGAYFQELRYLSGFTGDAGQLLVERERAGLWTDGRFFLPAEAELEDTGIELFRMNEEGVPTLPEYVERELPAAAVLAVDGRLLSVSDGRRLEDALRARGGRLDWEEDPLSGLWPERPALSAEPAWLLDERYAGRGAAEKLAELRADMKAAGAFCHVISTLEDIAWLLNLRGNDIAHCNVVLAFAVVEAERVLLFLNEAVLNDEVRAALAGYGVVFRPYGEIYRYLQELDPACPVLLSRAGVNLAMEHSLAGKQIIDRPNPCTLRRALKNPVEVENLREAHIKDGAAYVRFLYWLKKKADLSAITESDAAEYIDRCRAEMDGFVGVSFETIVGYAENAAINHYAPKRGSDKRLAPEGLLLIDSGGDYLEGSTDLTRTVALGPVPEAWKADFTRVLRGMLALMDIQFPKGVSGKHLDVLARLPLWQEGLNYRHGTGHGVGYLLSVHEGPNSFRTQKHPLDADYDWVFQPGMVTTDEPGYYVAHSHGIRLENELLCVERGSTEYGQFLGLESITLAPIDPEMLLPEMLEPGELAHLNRYHKAVFEALAPRLSAEEAAWLEEITRPITRK